MPTTLANPRVAVEILLTFGEPPLNPPYAGCAYTQRQAEVN